MSLIRQSTETQIERGGRVLITLVVGGALVLGGAAGVAYTLEHAHEGHADHPMVYFFGAVALLGALILPGIFTIVKPVLVFISPMIPKFGTRLGDVPNPPGVPPGTPIVPPTEPKP